VRIISAGAEFAANKEIPIKAHRVKLEIIKLPPDRENPGRANIDKFKRPPYFVPRQ
jgi:hypothetical protein